MFTRTVHFEAVKRSQPVQYKCKRCGKKRTKQVSVEQTVNPFNKNAAGLPKARHEVLEDVRERLRKEVTEVEAGINCNKCKDEIVAEREAARRVST